MSSKSVWAREIVHLILAASTRARADSSEATSIRKISMHINTVVDVVTNISGTARLVEGYSTLSRAERAGITLDQMRMLYKDLSKCTDEQVHGFMAVGHLLTSRRVSLKGTAFNARKPSPQPA